MTPSEQYQQEIKQGKICADPNQATAMAYLDDLYQQLLKKQSQYSRLWAAVKRYLIPKTIKGIYLWGGVGIGKTHLMNLFFTALPFERKRRLHYHQFMEQVHADLQRLQGEVDPLKIVARHFSLHADVLCLDEFMVSDITDAMILSGLLQALFERGVVLVTTSNTEPADLYKNGLQRQRFLPAIDLLQAHMQVLLLPMREDYRLRALEKAGVYFTPLEAKAEQALADYFEMYAHHEQLQEPLIIAGRPIPTRRLATHIVWFDFDTICHPPRSQKDYLAIAEQFKTVIISNVPQIKSDADNQITYFIKLVDVFYDANIELILSAATPPQDIYPQGRKIQEFQRTQSRLQEMQTHTYLQQCHRTP